MSANSTMLLPDSFMNPDRRDNASFALVGVQMCLDRRGKGGICAHRGLTHLDGPDSYLAVDDTEIGSGARIPLWMFGFLY